MVSQKMYGFYWATLYIVHVTLANCSKASIKKSSADSLARNKIWAVWWEASLWWGAWGPGPLPP